MLKRIVFLPLACGVGLGFAFAPYCYFSISFIACALFIFHLNNSKTKLEAFFLGLNLGLGFFGFGVSWVFLSIKAYSATPLLISLLLTFIFLVLQSLFFALVCLLYFLIFDNKHTIRSAIGFSLLWGVGEVLRSHFLGGFPWGLIGDLQVDSVLAPLLPIIGSPGTGIYFMLAASLLANGSSYLNHYNHKERAKGFYVLSLMMCFFIVPLTLTNTEWTNKGDKPPVVVGLVQANVSEQKKQDPDEIIPIIEQYRLLSRQLKQAKIIIWPESILAFLESSITTYLSPVYEETRESNKTLILGLPTKDTKNNTYHTSLIAINQLKSYYHKTHLVPFGEYIPISGLTALLNVLKIELPPFKPGTTIKAIKTKAINFSPLICYDIAYTERVNELNSDALLTLTDDAWFGHSFALAEHLQIGRARAYEQGREHVFVSNNGLTSVIDIKGHPKKIAPLYQQSALEVSVTPYTGKTPWHQFGYYRFITLVLTLLLSLIFV